MLKTSSVILLAIAAVATVGLSSCTSPQSQAMEEARLRAEDRAAYVPRNSLDFLNYDRRQRISDAPSTIVWCTMFPPTPGVRPITVPIVGKLTSGGKRPFATEPGPDGMYGSSGEYRYGFTPDGNMADIFNMASLCTTEPTVWQRNATEIVVAIDPGLAQAGDRAQAQLEAGGENAAGQATARRNAAATINNALGQ